MYINIIDACFKKKIESYSEVKQQMIKRELSRTHSMNTSAERTVRR